MVALQLLDEHDGSDVTSLFYGTNKDGHAHSKAAKELLKTFYVGRLSQATMHRQQEGESNKTDVASTQTGFSIIDESKPLLWQVWAVSLCATTKKVCLQLVA